VLIYLVASSFFRRRANACHLSSVHAKLYVLGVLDPFRFSLIGSPSFFSPFNPVMLYLNCGEKIGFFIRRRPLPFLSPGFLIPPMSLLPLLFSFQLEAGGFLLCSCMCFRAVHELFPPLPFYVIFPRCSEPNLFPPILLFFLLNLPDPGRFCRESVERPHPPDFLSMSLETPSFFGSARASLFL